MKKLNMFFRNFNVIAIGLVLVLAVLCSLAIGGHADANGNSLAYYNTNSVSKK